MDRGFFINGQWQKPDGMETFVIKDPATGARVGSTLLADGSTIDQAVSYAEKAAPAFARMSAQERASILCRAADLIEERVAAMARILTLEQGKPIADNQKEILFGTQVLRYYAGEATRVFGTLRPSAAPGIKISYPIIPWVLRRPLYHGTIRSISIAGNSAPHWLPAVRY